ncbi:hypothetical protein JOB18_048084 [Solea senegalensis]|uniref:Uncharacterized protein n=1 Tax=Solea senegalensis TaxID=28829 RepID=A0AAV6Q940_SOLSE|nr:hypothetical protein JOB18_048084 [Solea senegalensis]
MEDKVPANVQLTSSRLSALRTHEADGHSHTCRPIESEQDKEKRTAGIRHWELKEELKEETLIAALIKHGVGGGTESSSRAEEKGSNSSSQDGALTHNGPAILSAPPQIPN